MKTTNPKQSLKQQIIVTVAAVLALALILMMISSSSDSKEGAKAGPKKTEAASALRVSTVAAAPGSYAAHITAYGQAQAQRRLQISSEVSGLVTYLSPKLLSGEKFEQGERMFSLQDVNYQQALAAAKASLANAELELLQQQQNRKIALANWKRSGLEGEPSSELALYEPQIKAAKAALMSQEKNVEKASYDLQQTNIRAPFSLQLISRSIELGTWVQAGSALVDVFGRDVMEVRLPLSDRQWNNLPSDLDALRQQKVSLESVNGLNSWAAIIDRPEQHRSNDSRQRSLVVTVAKPLEQATPLLPATFLLAHISGLILENLWELPASALSDDNKIWYIDRDNKLATAEAQLRFAKAEAIFVEAIEGIPSTHIVRHPLSSYLPGMRAESSNQLSTAAAKNHLPSDGNLGAPQ